MKCSFCGLNVEEGEIFCPKCGQEIQWVPDYEPLGNILDREEQLKKEQARKALAKKKAAEELKKKKKRQTIITVSVIVAIIVAIIAVSLGMKVRDTNQKFNDFGYQFGMAETEFSNGNYEKSYEYVKRALELESRDISARLLNAQIQMQLEDDHEAIRILSSIIKDTPNNVAAYGLLLKIYSSNGKTEEIKSLLDKCESEVIREKYAAYICSTPIFSLSSGKYNSKKQVQLYGKTDITAIYYTVDGSKPTTDSILYTGGIQLEEGTTTIKAIGVNKNGIVSDVASNEYSITLLPPSAPQISPSSGKFTTDMDTKIYIIVPNGCTAYYAFDKKPTITDEVYNPDKPVKMQMGTHTFYAILVDENGKVSFPGSAIYTLAEAE